MKRLLLASLVVAFLPSLALAGDRYRGYGGRRDSGFVSFGYDRGYHRGSSFGFSIGFGGHSRPYYGGYSRPYYGGHYHYARYRPVYVAPPPVYYAPAPVYVEPAPVYYAPRPRYYYDDCDYYYRPARSSVSFSYRYYR
jgi:hypothetical protein